MSLFDVFWHLAAFVAPALVLAVGLALTSRILGKNSTPRLALPAQVAINFVAGCAVLVAGLVVLGRDGKMLTYAALVLGCATCQWVLVRGWRG